MKILVVSDTHGMDQRFYEVCDIAATFREAKMKCRGI